MCTTQYFVFLLNNIAPNNDWYSDTDSEICWRLEVERCVFGHWIDIVKVQGYRIQDHCYKEKRNGFWTEKMK